MKAQKECFECLKRQAQAHHVTMEKYCDFLDAIPKDQDGASLAFSPPQIAVGLYEKIAKELEVDDLFACIKTQSIQKAYQLLEMVNFKNFSLEEAIRLSAMGNVIDYGSASEFSIQDFDFLKEFEALDFACFEDKKFRKILEKANVFIMLGDNAGENIFDEVLLRVLAQEYPKLKLYYFVRGRPIINDITLKDLHLHHECKGIFDIATVIDSGVKSPGFVYQNATLEAQEIFSCADVILSKGMGNFECLDESCDSRVFYLLKIKCQVVAKRLGFELGKMFFGQNQDFL